LTLSRRSHWSIAYYEKTASEAKASAMDAAFPAFPLARALIAHCSSTESMPFRPWLLSLAA